MTIIHNSQDQVQREYKKNHTFKGETFSELVYFVY